MQVTCFSIYGVGNGSFHRNDDVTVCDLLSYSYCLIQFDLYRPNSGPWRLCSASAICILQANALFSSFLLLTAIDIVFSFFLHLFVPLTSTNLLFDSHLVIHDYLHYFHQHHHHQNRSQCTVYLPAPIDILEILKCNKYYLSIWKLFILFFFNLCDLFFCSYFKSHYVMKVVIKMKVGKYSVQIF